MDGTITKYDWETVPNCGESVRRLPVPGGWVYQVNMSQVTFVPEPNEPKITIVHNVGDVSRPVTGPSKARGALPTEAKVLSDLTEGLRRLLQGVKHHDKFGNMLHECDVAEVALEKLTDYIISDSGAVALSAYPGVGSAPIGIQALAHKVAGAAGEFKAFFENKYAGEVIRCTYINTLFDAVEELEHACDEYAGALSAGEIEAPYKPAFEELLSEAPVG